MRRAVLIAACMSVMMCACGTSTEQNTETTVSPIVQIATGDPGAETYYLQPYTTQEGISDAITLVNTLFKNIDAETLQDTAYAKFEFGTMGIDISLYDKENHCLRTARRYFTQQSHTIDTWKESAGEPFEIVIRDTEGRPHILHRGNDTHYYTYEQDGTVEQESIICLTYLQGLADNITENLPYYELEEAPDYDDLMLGEDVAEVVYQEVDDFFNNIEYEYEWARYEFDDSGLIVKMTESSQEDKTLERVYSFKYDDGYITEEVYECINDPSRGLKIQYEYDGNRRLKQKTYADYPGNKTIYETTTYYDEANNTISQLKEEADSYNDLIIWKILPGGEIANTVLRDDEFTKYDPFFSKYINK